MKAKSRITTAIAISILILSTGSVSAQKDIKIGFKKLGEIINSNDYNHCTESVCFENAQETLSKDSKNLNEAHGKRKARLVKKLKKSLKRYIKSFEKKFPGFASRIQASKSLKSIRRLIHLKNINKEIINVLDSSPELLSDSEIKESVQILKRFQKQIESKLTKIQ